MTLETLGAVLLLGVVFALAAVVAVYGYLDQQVGRDPVSPRDWRRIETPANMRGFQQKKGRVQ